MSIADWIGDALPAGYANAVLILILALALLFAVLGMIRIWRHYGTGTFVAGGRNRKTRLAVMDAAAVDGRRRRVLVRRDDVEHLILIGGPSDVVVEQNIRMIQRPQRQAEAPDQFGAKADPVAAVAERPVLQQRAVMRPTEAPRPVEPVARPVVAAAPLPRPAMPTSGQQPQTASMVRAVAPENSLRNFEYPKSPSQAPKQLPVAKDLDEALLDELEGSLNEVRKASAAQRTDPTLDEQMNRLLGEIGRKA